MSYLDGYPFTSSQERAHPLVEGGGEYRPRIGGVDIIEYVRANGHGVNGPRDLNEKPYDLFDGPLPGQSFEAWRQALDPNYRPPAA